MKHEKKQDKYAVTEMYYPSILGVLSVLVCHFCTYTKIYDISNFLDAIINFASILLGFLGAILALLFSFNENSFIKYIMTNDFYRTRLKHYFKVSILSGFLLVVCSIIMLMQLSITFKMFPVVKCISENLYYLEVFLITYFVLSSYRIISFVLKCAFMQYDRQEEIYPENEYTDKEIEELREMCSTDSSEEQNE